MCCDPETKADWATVRFWGAIGDRPMGQSDFDGDRRTDMAVWQPRDGTWRVLTSRSNWNPASAIVRQWGAPGDWPIRRADFDGDGRTDMAVWRPSDSTWYVLTSSTSWDPGQALVRPWGKRDAVEVDVATRDAMNSASSALRPT